MYLQNSRVSTMYAQGSNVAQRGRVKFWRQTIVSSRFPLATKANILCAVSFQSVSHSKTRQDLEKLKGSAAAFCRRGTAPHTAAATSCESMNLRSRVSQGFDIAVYYYVSSGVSIVVGHSKREKYYRCLVVWLVGGATDF